MSDEQWFILEINPEPWAIGPVSVGRKGGKLFPMVGRNVQLHHYKEAIKEELGPQELIEDAITIRFFFWRNRAIYVTPQARSHRKHEADLTNLQKATEDALQGVLFKNDKDVDDIHSVMVAQGPDIVGKIVIAIKSSYPTSVYEFFPDRIMDKLLEIDRVETDVQEQPKFDIWEGSKDKGMF